MKLSPEQRCNEMRARGHWGDSDTWSRFARTASMHPASTALTDPPNRTTLVGGAPRSLTYAELEKAALSVAAQLHAAGLQKGAHLIMQLPNIAEAVVILLAAARLGLVISPIPMQYASHEIRLISRRLHPAGYIGCEHFRSEDASAGARAELPIGTRQMNIVADAESPQIALGRYPLESDIDALPAPGHDADDIFTICWTAGSTGTPKGVPRSHNLWLGQATPSAPITLSSQDAMLCPVSLLNVYGLGWFFYPWLEHGAHLCLHHPMDMDVLLKQIEDHRPDWMMLPPALLNLIAAKPDIARKHNWGAARFVFTGGARVTAKALQFASEELKLDICNIFASSEGLLLTAGPESLPDPAQRACFFRPDSATLETRLADPQSGELIDDGIGEIQIRGPFVIDRYLTDERSDSSTRTGDGFFRCGDLFRISADNPDLLEFVGRSKNAINRGGMQVSPEEVSAVLKLHPAIRDCTVLGLNDAVLGERVCAVIVPTHGSMNLDDVNNFLDWQGLARFKWPERLFTTQRLPYDRLGKIDSAAVRELIAKRP